MERTVRLRNNYVHMDSLQRTMTYSSVLRYLQRLASGDPESWKYLPYQLNMFCRGIDLSGVNPRDIGLSEERSAGHRDSGGPDLDKLLQTLPISQSDTVLDIGCGKGGAMLALAKYPFARVDGVELSPQLAQIAQQNLRRLRISNTAIYCRDAADFVDLDSYTYFYMYNPFPEIVMRSVIGNIVSSLIRRRRKVTLIYKNPQMHNLVVAARFRKILETRQTHHPFAIYVWESVANPTSQECVRG